MKSATIYTNELDNIPAAVQELVSQLEDQLPLLSNSVGLLLCDPDVDHRALLTALRTRLPFELVGGTSFGMIGSDGLHDFCVALTVLTADDCTFSVGVTPSISTDNARDAIAQAYKMAVPNPEHSPALLYALPPDIYTIPFDEYPDVLGELSGGAPVIGGVPSSNPPFDATVSFWNETIYKDSMVLLAISGNVRPLFCMQNMPGMLSEYKRQVTRAEGSILYEVGDTTITEHLQQIGLITKYEGRNDQVFNFGSNPIMVEPEDGSEAFLRSIRAVDIDEKIAYTLGRVPEGALITVGMMRRSDVEISATEAMKAMEQKIQSNQHDDYEYSTLLCVSCMGRFMITAPDSAMESELIAKAFGGRYNVAGFYANGELCARADYPDRDTSRFHTHSLTMCLL